MSTGSGAARGNSGGGQGGGNGGGNGGGKPESIERLFYNLKFPRRGVVALGSDIGVGYDTLRQAFPERVRLTALDGIFVSWTTSYKTKYPHLPLSKTSPYAMTSYSGQRKVFFYHHDGFDYRSTIVFGDFDGYPRIEVKVSNNGFIYPRETSLVTDPSFPRTIWHHQRDGWALIEEETAKAAFPVIFAFAAEVMGMAHPKFRVLFHEGSERVDLSFVDFPPRPTFGVLVAFEEGYPETLHSLDLWHSG